MSTRDSTSNNYMTSSLEKINNRVNDDDSDDGFTLVTTRERKKKQQQRLQIKYDTRSSCPSDNCSKFSDQTPVMDFVRKVSDRFIEVQCKWCKCRYQIELKVLPVAAHIQEKTTRPNPEKPKQQPRPVIEKKTEPLDTRNIFGALAPETDSD